MIWIPMAIMAIEDADDYEFVLKLFLEHEQMMFRTALKVVKDEQTAMDMVSLAYVKIIDKLRRVRKIEQCKLTRYIARIVKNEALMYLRKKKRERLRLIDNERALDWAVTEYHDVDERLIAEAETEEIIEAMNQIHKKDRELLHMKYFENLLDDEIAAQMGIGRDSVRSYLTKARRNLGEVLKRREQD